MSIPRNWPDKLYMNNDHWLGDDTWLWTKKELQRAINEIYPKDRGISPRPKFNDCVKETFALQGHGVYIKGMCDPLEKDAPNKSDQLVLPEKETTYATYISMHATSDIRVRCWGINHIAWECREKPYKTGTGIFDIIEEESDD